MMTRQTMTCGAPKEKHIDPKDNNVYFYRGVSDEAVTDLCADLEEAQRTIRNTKFAVDKLKGGTGEMPPIQLYLNSFGGDLFAGISAYHYIRQLQHPVHVHVVGCAMSAASLILLAGEHRSISKYATVLIHQLRTSFWGRHDELVDESKNMLLVMKQLQLLYQERTGLPKQKIESLLKHDLYLSPEECLKLGFVQNIEG